MHRLPTCLCAAAALALALFASPLAAGAAESPEWSQFRGPNGAATSSETDLPTTWSAEENIAWKTELPGPGTSSPILLGDRIYLTCYTGYKDGRGSIEDLKRHLVCLNRADGKIRWTKDVEARQPEETKNREGHGYASSTPIADDERIYVFFGISGVLAFDHDGNQLWQTEVGSGTNGWGSATSPVFYKTLLIVNASVESSSLVALDRASGKEVWRAKDVKESWNTPIFVQTADGKTELVVAVMHKILGFDPDTGKQLWSCKTDIPWYMAPSLVSHEDVVYSVGGRPGGSLAVRTGGRGDVTLTHRLWTGKKGSNVTSPVYHDGHVYWMHDNQGMAFCAKADTGELVYQERVRGADGVYSSPILAGGRLYYFTRSGRAFVLPAKPEFEILAQNNLESRGNFNASPAVADGRLLIRSDKFLYAIGKN